MGFGCVVGRLIAGPGLLGMVGAPLPMGCGVATHHPVGAPPNIAMNPLTSLVGHPFVVVAFGFGGEIIVVVYQMPSPGEGLRDGIGAREDKSPPGAAQTVAAWSIPARGGGNLCPIFR